MAGGYPKPSGIEPERFDHIPARVSSRSSSSNAVSAPGRGTSGAALSSLGQPQTPKSSSTSQARGPDKKDTVLGWQAWLLPFEPLMPSAERLKYRAVVTTLAESLIVELDRSEVRKHQDSVRKMIAEIEQDKAALVEKKAAIAALVLEQRLADSFSTQTDPAQSGISSSAQTGQAQCGISSSTQTGQAQCGISSSTQTDTDADEIASIDQDTRFQDQESDTDAIPTPPTAAPTPSLAPVLPAYPVSTQSNPLSSEGRTITAYPVPTQSNPLFSEGGTITAYPVPTQSNPLSSEGGTITASLPSSEPDLTLPPGPTRRSTLPTATNSLRERTIQFGSTIFAWDSNAEWEPPTNCLGLRPKGQTDQFSFVSNSAAPSPSAGTGAPSSISVEADTQTTSFALPQAHQRSIESSSPTNHSSTSAGTENQAKTPSKRFSKSKRSSKLKPSSEVRRSAAPPKKKAKKKAAESDGCPESLAKHLVNTNRLPALGLPATVPTTHTDPLFAAISAAACAGTENQQQKVDQFNQLGDSSAFQGIAAQVHLIDQLSAEFRATSSAPGKDNQQKKDLLLSQYKRLVELSTRKDPDTPDADKSKGTGKDMNPPAYESLVEVFDHGKYLDDNMVHILLAASGSVATIKVPVIIRELAKLGKSTPPISIRVIITDAAAGFLADQADEQPDYRNLESLPCVSGVYTNDDEWEVPWVRGNKILHIELRRWADIMVVAPLSANTLAKIVGGMSDNLLLSTVRAWDVFGNYDARHTIEFMGKKIFFGNRSPDLSKLLKEDGVVIEDDADAEIKGESGGIAGQMHRVAIGESSDTKKKAKTYGRKCILVAPSMNPAMWDHPVTKEHIDVLQNKWGGSVENGWIEVLGPINKTVACGDSGTGAMMEATDIVKRIRQIVTPS